MPFPGGSTAPPTISLLFASTYQSSIHPFMSPSPTTTATATAAAAPEADAPFSSAPPDSGALLHHHHAFDMASLQTHLPKKRKGLSRFICGKSKSFACLGDAKCIDDLRKTPEVAKSKRRKYLDRQASAADAPEHPYPLAS